MEVPSFVDLGKNARDVFKTAYHQGKGLINFNVKTKSAKRFQMMSDTTLNFEASKVGLTYCIKNIMESRKTFV